MGSVQFFFIPIIDLSLFEFWCKGTSFFPRKDVPYLAVIVHFRNNASKIFSIFYTFVVGTGIKKAKTMNIEPEEFIVRTDRCETLLQPFCKLKDACILLCLCGKAQIEIDSEEYSFEPDTHAVLLPGTIIGQVSTSPDFEARYIVFTHALFREVTCRLDPSFFRFLNETPTVTLPEERLSSIKAMMSLIEELYRDRNNCFRGQIVRNNLQSFLMHIYDKTQRFFIDRHPEGISRQEELFKQFIQMIHEHCTRQREVSFYADKLCISPRYLSTIVQSVTGTTAKNIIDRHVILEIKAMLKSTALSVQEISHRLHFPDQSFFGRYFKKHTGMSPLEYRKEF